MWSRVAVTLLAMSASCHAGLLGAGTGEGSCPAAPFRSAAVKYPLGCPPHAACCSEYGYCRPYEEWVAGGFRDCNGDSNGLPLPESAIAAENQAAALGDAAGLPLLNKPAGALIATSPAVPAALPAAALPAVPAPAPVVAAAPAPAPAVTFPAAGYAAALPAAGYAAALPAAGYAAALPAAGYAAALPAAGYSTAEYAAALPAAGYSAVLPAAAGYAAGAYATAPAGTYDLGAASLLPVNGAYANALPIGYATHH